MMKVSEIDSADIMNQQRNCLSQKYDMVPLLPKKPPTDESSTVMTNENDVDNWLLNNQVPDVNVKTQMSANQPQVQNNFLIQPAERSERTIPSHPMFFPQYHPQNNQFMLAQQQNLIFQKQ